MPDMTPAEITRRSDELRKKERDIKAECQRLEALTDPTNGDVERMDRMLTAWDNVKEEMNGLRTASMELIREAAQDPANREIGQDTGSIRTVADQIRVAGQARYGDSLRGDALRLVDSMRIAPDEGRERLAAAIDYAAATDANELDLLARWTIITGAPAYARAMSKIFKDPTNGHREFDGEELDAFQRAQAFSRTALQNGSGTGSYLLPTHLDPQIMLSNAGSISPMRDLARVVTIGTNTYHGVSSAGVTASWDGEVVEVSDDTPTLSNPTIPTYKGAAFVQASFESFEDTSISSQVGELFADAKVQLESTAFTTGAGSTEPKGVITAVAAVGGSVVAPTTAETYGRLDPKKVMEAVPARFRANARFMANLSIINLSREFSRLASGTEESLVDDSGPRPRMYGWEIVENSAMDGTYDASATAAHNYLLIAGDFKKGYTSVDRIGATVQFIPTLFNATTNLPDGRVGWYVHWRTGGDAVLTGAFRLLDIPTSA